MKNLLCTVLIILLCFSCLVSCSSTETDTIKIGSVHPLTGGMAYEGQALVNTQQIAIDKINKEGGINGKMLELVVADSLGTVYGASSAAQKLINKNVIALTGAYTSSSAQIVSREAEKARVPFVVTVAASSSLLKNGYKYSFRIQPNTEVFSKNFIEYFDFIKTEDMKTVAFIYEDSNYGTGIVDFITKNIEKTGLEIVGSISYSASTSTLSAEVTRLAGLDPDVLIPIGYYSDQAMLVKEIQDRGIKFDTIIGVANGAISDAKLTDIYGDKLDGYLDINYRYNTNSEETKELLSEYRLRFGEEMPVAAVYGYESIMVIADALKRTDVYEPENLRDSLSSCCISDHVLPQPTIKFDSTGEGIDSAGVLIQIQKGNQVIVYPLEYAESDYIPMKENEE